MLPGGDRVSVKITIKWRRNWQPTPVFLPGKFHGHRSLAGYSPWGHKDLDTTEVTTLTQYFFMIKTFRKVEIEGEFFNMVKCVYEKFTSY